MTATIDAWALLGPLDLIVFTAILLATMAAIVYGHRRQQAPGDRLLDYMLMGRRLTLPLFTATLVATWYGGLFGVTEIAFQYGIYNFITQGVFWYVTYIFFALVLAKRVRESDAKTLPELVGQLFGPKSARLAGIFNFLNVVPVAYAISLGLLLQAVFGWPLLIGMLAGTSLVCVYAMLGGFRAVVLSDLVQFGVMCISVALVAVLSVSQFGGLGFLQEALPATHFSVTGGQPVGTLIVWGLIAMSTLVDPNFYQRCFAAETPDTAKRGILLATVVWVLFDICTTAGAMYARAVIPETESGLAYLTYALQLLPDGLRGFFLAGVLATILSTLDSYIFVAGNTLAYDLAPEKWRGRVSLERLGIVIAGALAVGLGLYFDGSVKTVWKTLGSYSAGCLLLPVLWGLFRPGRVSDGRFVLSCLAGVVAISVWRNMPRSGFWANVDDLYLGLAATAVTLAITGILSRIFSHQEPEEKPS